MRKRTVGDNPR